MSGMHVVRSDQVGPHARSAPAVGAGGPALHWVGEPGAGEGLDVGLVSLPPGASTPPHVHTGGQVLVGHEGHGFVRSADEYVEFGPGDVVVCPPGQPHEHGALPDEPLVHLTVTTGAHGPGDLPPSPPER